MKKAEVEIIDMCRMCELGKSHSSHGVTSYYEDCKLMIGVHSPSQTMAAIHTIEFWKTKNSEIDEILLQELGNPKYRINITNYRTRKINYIFVPEEKEKLELLTLLYGYEKFLSGKKVDFPINVYFVEISDKWEGRIMKQNGLFEYEDIKFLSSEDASNSFNKKIRNAFGRAKKGETNEIKIICPFERVILNRK